MSVTPLFPPDGEAARGEYPLESLFSRRSSLIHVRILPHQETPCSMGNIPQVPERLNHGILSLAQRCC